MTKTLARTTPKRELQAPLESAILAPRGECPPLRGFGSVLFVCPTCGVFDRFGTVDGGLRGRCRFGDCAFTWLRHHDWRVFLDRATLTGFRSLDEFEAQLAP
jgi:hypothetical protein